MRKKKGRWLAGALAAMLLLGSLAGCKKDGPVTPTPPTAEPVTVTVWHYYNGVQQQLFDEMVKEFNETMGLEQRITVEARSKGTVGELTNQMEDALAHVVGADAIPDAFAAYADTAYEFDQAGLLANLSSYMTDEECAAYLDSYLQEGNFDDQGLKIFPVAKSTELLMVNATAWVEFQQATGASEGDFATWEGMAAVAEEYYRWTDAQTPDVADDGAAFFGRDAFANYMLVGSLQLGTELFQVENGVVSLQVDERVMRRLWDCFYVPYLNGYYTALGKFRSDDIRTGDIVAMICSSSGATYFPKEVTDEMGNTAAIEGAVYPLPNFAGTDPVAVQQGAGIVVTKSDARREGAAVTFLKWFTAPEQNLRFAVGSGYLPVTVAANEASAVSDAADAAGTDALMVASLQNGVEVTNSYELYTTKPFEHGYSARKVVEDSMQSKAAADRAAAESLMVSGVSREEAVAQYTSEENFQAWLADFTAKLQETIGQ